MFASIGSKIFIILRFQCSTSLHMRGSSCLSMVEKMGYITACIAEWTPLQRQRKTLRHRETRSCPPIIYFYHQCWTSSLCTLSLSLHPNPWSIFSFLINTHLLLSISLLSHLPSPPSSHISPPPPLLLFSSSPSLIAQPLQYFLYCRARQNIHTHSHTHGWQVKAGFSVFLSSSTPLALVFLHRYSVVFICDVCFMLGNADRIQTNACIGICTCLFVVGRCLRCHHVRVLQLQACSENGCQVHFVGAERDLRAYMCEPSPMWTLCLCVSLSSSIFECVCWERKDKERMRLCAF